MPPTAMPGLPSVHSQSSSGVIAALHGQGLDIGTAAGMGVYVHARAGDAAADAAGQRGLLPMDLLDWLRHYVNPART